jgi:hypothetical protein
MVKTPLNIFLMYGLVGLAIAGGIITVSHVTSKVVPVFPKYGQLNIDLILSSSTMDQSGSYVSYASLNDYARGQENDTLRVTTDSVMVYRSGTFNPTAGWTTLQDATRSVTLRTGVKVHLGSLTLPEGNVTIVRVKIVGATIQRGPNGVSEDIGTQSVQFDIATHSRVNAQTTTKVLVDFHVACSSTANGGSSGHGGCTVTPSAENED